MQLLSLSASASTSASAALAPFLGDAPWLTLLVALVMFATAVVGVVTGGNSLVNVPVMIMLGLTPRRAVATNMFAVTFMTLSATVRFARAGALRGRLPLILAIIAGITGALGAQMTVKLPEAIVKTLVAVSLAALSVFTLSRGKRGTTPPPATPTRRGVGYALSAVLGIYGGLFSGGYTTLLTFLCVQAFALTLREAVAVTKPVNLASCAVATLVFWAGGLIDLHLGVPCAIANFAGGWVGARVAARMSERWLRILFLGTVALLAAKLLLWDVLVKRVLM